MANLDAAIKAGWVDYRSMMLDPRFDTLRKTPAFQATLKQLTTKVEKMRRQTPGRKLAVYIK